MCQGGPELRRSHGRLRTVSAEAGVGWGLLLPRGSLLPELMSGNSLRMCLRSYKRADSAAGTSWILVLVSTCQSLRRPSPYWQNEGSRRLAALA